MKVITTALIAAMLAATPALAEKPEWAGMAGAIVKYNVEGFKADGTPPGQVFSQGAKDGIPLGQYLQENRPRKGD